MSELIAQYRKGMKGTPSARVGEAKDAAAPDRAPLGFAANGIRVMITESKRRLETGTNGQGGRRGPIDERSRAMGMRT